MESGGVLILVFSSPWPLERFWRVLGCSKLFIGGIWCFWLFPVGPGEFLMCLGLSPVSPEDVLGYFELFSSGFCGGS